MHRMYSLALHLNKDPQNVALLMHIPHHFTITTYSILCQIQRTDLFITPQLQEQLFFISIVAKQENVQKSVLRISYLKECNDYSMCCECILLYDGYCWYVSVKFCKLEFFLVLYQIFPFHSSHSYSTYVFFTLAVCASHSAYSCSINCDAGGAQLLLD